MTVRKIRREEAVRQIAEHLVRNGLAASSLRTLAEAAGTSDRMLMYYFTDKDDIIVAALQEIGHQLAAMLGQMVSPGAGGRPDAVLRTLAPIIRGETLRPYMRLWLELAMLAAAGREPYRATAGAIADGFIAWVAEKLDPRSVRGVLAAASRVVATLDGMVLLDFVGRSDAADRILEDFSGRDAVAKPHR